MSRLRWALICLAGLVASIAFVAPAGADPAQTTISNFAFPIGGTISGPCYQEPIALEGTARLVVTFTTDATGGRHFHATFTLQGVKGIGTVTGTVYRLIQNQQMTSQGPAPFGPSSGTFSNQVLLIGPGPGNNVLLQVVAHFTINANDELTSLTVETHGRCASEGA